MYYVKMPLRNMYFLNMGLTPLPFEQCLLIICKFVHPLEEKPWNGRTSDEN